ncbi:MAG: UDP-N-acetylmuramate--L-alanine ligase [Vicinamibacteria bacterium]|nr:UDP-N-acetylmuramate--L-alanine ligase [Vicinamibacteria bacterium]
MRGVRRIHFVGIAGAGMSGIAELLLAQGYEVSGSDLKPGPVGERLARLGVRVETGHAAEHVGDAQVVVVSSAVPVDNAEVLAARQRGVPVIPRAEMLAELMRLKQGVVVGGSHGKTTTTSMVAAVLEYGGLDPSVIVGGRLRALDSGARMGSGLYLVAEADESDRSFLKLQPVIAVVTNVDREHLDAYADLADVQAAFLDFLNKVPFYGAAIVCLDDAPLAALLPRLTRRVIGYGTGATARVTARDVVLEASGSRYTALVDGRELGSIQLAVPGRHNVLNSLAALAVGLELELPFERIVAGLQSFSGVDRRFQRRGEAGGITVVDDYGHHPAEIRATLETLRLVAGERRTLVVFQPHRYTRTQALWDDFCTAFADADVLLVCDVYAAGEAVIEGVDARRLAAALRARGHDDVSYAGGVAEAARRLLERARPGDVVLTLGAGNVAQAADALLQRGAA